MAQPAGAFLSEDWSYSEIRWASQELYFFDDVYARPLNAHPNSGTVIEATSAARGTAIVLWRGPRNRIGPATPVDEMWALIDTPDRAPGVLRVPQTVDPDAAGCGVLFPGEPTNGIVGRGIHALVTILEHAEPVLVGLLGEDRERAYVRVNAAIIQGMRA